jgi:hypothetical protein
MVDGIAVNHFVSLSAKALAKADVLNITFFNLH